ncbi:MULTISPECIES: hypothetical protein [unclassified Clostridium]|uniref:hypothetical protein n=1 Tax=unclassified Clostridium TaxID=2614128 RepID=UPI000297D975|nr:MULTISPECIES: hypothetical protein [unclassified Clostridium]EKQ57619.1 MAG: hypothetical protein A370_00751 [Clostridium sp. Maddingley MBC34-26]
MDRNFSKDSKRNGLIFDVMIPMLISLPITFILDSEYYKLQVLKFKASDTLLFIHDNVSEKIIFFSPYIVVLLIILSFRNRFQYKIIKINICLLIGIIVFLSSTILLYLQFFKYTAIERERIYISNGIFSKSEEYKWIDVTQVEASYKRGNRNKIIIIYDIYLNDGKIIDTCNSDDFFEKIIDIDNIMKDNNITINRKKILSSDYDDFVIQYKDKEKDLDVDRLDVILKILDK